MPSPTTGDPAPSPNTFDEALTIALERANEQVVEPDYSYLFQEGTDYERRIVRGLRNELDDIKHQWLSQRVAKLDRQYRGQQLSDHVIYGFKHSLAQLDRDWCELGYHRRHL